MQRVLKPCTMVAGAGTLIIGQRLLTPFLDFDSQEHDPRLALDCGPAIGAVCLFGYSLHEQTHG